MDAFLPPVPSHKKSTVEELPPMRSFVVAFSLLISAAALAAPRLPKTFPTRAGGPAIEIGEASVALSGATPGARVYLASVSLGSGSYQISVASEAAVVTADATGAAVYSTPRPVETRGVWIAVDGTTGGYTVAAPRGTLLREIDFPGNGFAQTGNGAWRRFALVERYSVEAIVIRPSVGMWSGSLRDGGNRDEDKTIDGAIEADIASLTPVGDAPAAPERIMPGDLLVLIDRVTLEYHVAVHGK
jgi:hypothetical protein